MAAMERSSVMPRTESEAWDDRCTCGYISAQMVSHRPARHKTRQARYLLFETLSLLVPGGLRQSSRGTGALPARRPGARPEELVARAPPDQGDRKRQDQSARIRQPGLPWRTSVQDRPSSTGSTPSRARFGAREYGDLDPTGNFKARPGRREIASSLNRCPGEEGVAPGWRTRGPHRPNCSTVQA